jgi:uncharacterized protein with GYD domain
MSKNSEARPRRGTQTGSIEFSLTMPSRCAVIMREENNNHLHSALQPDRRWDQGRERLAAPARRRQEVIGPHWRRDEAVYMVMSEFDFVGICEAPDDAVMARYVLQLGGLGFVRTKTLNALPETVYREIIRSLG